MIPLFGTFCKHYLVFCLQIDSAIENVGEMFVGIIVCYFNCS